MEKIAKRGIQVICILTVLTILILISCVGQNYKNKNSMTEVSETNEPVELEMNVVALAEDEVITEESEYIIETEYDEEIVVENGLEFHYIAGDTFRGLMTIIKDPSRLFVGMPHASYDGTAGASATNVAARYDALYAVNGAFFLDTNYKGNGGTPIGFVFSEGTETYGGTGTAYTLMGWDNNNNFIIDKMTGAQAVQMGIRDAVTCKPILVKDGAITDLSGASLTLIDARTCVGARADGAVLLLTIDGRMSHSFGATTTDCANVMLAFGAVNAGNLDGGGSVSIYYGGETPIDSSLASLKGSRPSPEAICVRRQ